MLFLMFLLMLSWAPSVGSINGGSVLFYKEQNQHKVCWSQEEMALLRARKAFEELIVPGVSPEKINKKYVRNTVRYFRNAIDYMQKTADPQTVDLLREAAADTIGGYLRSELLPNVKIAYYAGYIPYADLEKVNKLYEDMKTILNTKGLGWRPPSRAPPISNLTVGKIVIGLGKLRDPCACLVLKRDANNCIRLSFPKIDSNSRPSAMALPFKTGGLVGLSSPNSENVLLKYYTTASRCILQSSPPGCRHKDFVTYNTDMWHWMKRSIAPHLMDEEMYPAFGGVLRVAAAVQSYGKGHSRRYSMEEWEDKWHPWRSLSESSVFTNTDWTSKRYIIIIVGAMLLICSVQFVYEFFFRGCSRGGNCGGLGRRPSTSNCKGVAYARVDSNFPAMLPAHQARRMVSTDMQCDIQLHKCKSVSAGTLKTQRVYDLNDNTEKLMSVIMNDQLSDVIVTSSESSDEEEGVEETVIDMRGHAQSLKSRSQKSSPPLIDAAMTQVIVNKPVTGANRSRTRLYYTDTATETTFNQGRLSDTEWSESSTSSRSVTSTSVKSRRHERSQSRDLAWVRRVACKNSSSIRSARSTVTDVNSYIGSNSFTTPPSRR